MASQADSIEIQTTVAPVQSSSGHDLKLTPRQVLERLPEDATPAQQDSAIRANIKPEPITHWSERPDTLHMPGHSPAGGVEAELPVLYYKESFFAKDSMFHPELRGGRRGVAGDPVPYSIAGDSLISSILILSFFLSVLAISRLRHVISQQVRRFSLVGGNRLVPLAETSEEFRHQLFLVLVTCLMLAIDCFLCFHVSHESFFTIPEYWVIGMYVGIMVCYFALKFLLYAMIGAVFFDKRDNEQWMRPYLFLVSLEGVLLFPAIMLTAYSFISTQSIQIYTLILVFFVKMSSLYRYKSIFFKKKGVFLQIILYFCALQVMPLLVLMGILVMVSHYMEINF